MSASDDNHSAELDLKASGPSRRGVVVEQVQDPKSPHRIEGACQLWRRYGVLDEAEVARRVSEVLVVAVDQVSDEVVGVSTCYLATPSNLQLPMWVYRTFVAPEWRGYVIYPMWRAAFDYHEKRFLDGTDTRAKGLYVEVQNRHWQREHTEAVWSRGWFTYIGPSPSGADCRVAYFKGARIR